MKRREFITIASIFVLTFALTVSMLRLPRHVTAAPNAIPTPVAGVTYDDTFGRLTFLPGAAITATGGGLAQNVSPFRTCDIQWDVDVTVVNTSTFTLQFSNDGTYWSNGAAIATDVVADTGRSTTGSGNLQQFAVFGRYGRVYSALTSSDPITPSVSALCH